MKRFLGLSVAALVGVFVLSGVTLLSVDSNTASAAPPSERKCDDGVDNDRDGLIDAADPDCADNGGNTGKGQDTPADFYLYHDPYYGILGDGWYTGGDPVLNPVGDATLYPANKTLNGTYSCANAIITDQDPGHVRVFVPSGTTDGCTSVNRFIQIRSDYDLDQDGLCVIPYAGRKDARGFQRFYDCSAGVEPDGLEEIMATVHLFEAFSSDGYTPVEIQVRLLDYGDGYIPSGSYDPGLDDIESIGAQERAFVITLDSATMSVPDGADPEVRAFENQQGTATMCEVVWKNSKAKDCNDIVDGNGDPVVISGLTIKGKVDPTPLP